MSEKVKPSIPAARCIGVVPLCEEFYIPTRGVKLEWSSVSEEKKIELLKTLTRAVNAKDRALWAAAEELSNFGEGQREIYCRLSSEGRKLP